MKNFVVKDISIGKPPPRQILLRLSLGLLAMLKIEDNVILLKIEYKTM
jgi:hypothetical protein